MPADDFDVSIFLTPTETRHSLLHKQKHFRDKVQTKLTSNSSRLVGESREAPIDVDDPALGDADVDPVPIRTEESDEINLDDIPTVAETEESLGATNRRLKRRRPAVAGSGSEEGRPGGDGQNIETISTDDSSDDGLFVGDSEADSDDDADARPRPKRRKDQATASDDADQDDSDKKKLGMDISYEGFALYGRVLCLVVKRRGGSQGGPLPANINLPQTGQLGGQAKMENWITSTQLPVDVAGDEAL
jgi:hypothetical protein